MKRFEVRVGIKSLRVREGWSSRESDKSAPVWCHPWAEPKRDDSTLETWSKPPSAPSLWLSVYSCLWMSHVTFLSLEMIPFLSNCVWAPRPTPAAPPHKGWRGLDHTIWWAVIFRWRHEPFTRSGRNDDRWHLMFILDPPKKTTLSFRLNYKFSRWVLIKLSKELSPAKFHPSASAGHNSTLHIFTSY